MTLSRTTRVSVGFGVGCVLIVVGVFMVAGIPGALISTGVILAGTFLLLAPVDDAPPPPPGPNEESTP